MNRKKRKLLLLLAAVIAVTFIFAGCNSTLGQKKCYTIEEVKGLYESGALTRQNLLDMAYNCNGGIIDENKELYPENYVPVLFDPDSFDNKIKEKIIKAIEDELEQKVAEIYYYGTYNDFILLRYTRSGIAITSEPGKVSSDIDGVAFTVFAYPEIARIVLYRKN